MSRVSLSYLENGHVIIRASDIIRLAEILDQEPAWFLTDLDKTLCPCCGQKLLMQGQD